MNHLIKKAVDASRNAFKVARFPLGSATVAIGSNAFILGVSLSFAVVLSAWNKEHLSAKDEVTAPHVVDGRLHVFFAGKHRPTPSRLEAEGERSRFAVRLGTLITPADSILQDGKALVHHADIVFSGTTMKLSNGTFLDEITINHSWEVVFQNDETVVTQGKPALVRPGQSAFRNVNHHVGHRLVSVEEIQPLLIGLGTVLGRDSSNDKAVWAVSELSRKTVRVHSTSSGIVLSVQPLGVDLSKNAVDWLRKFGLPRLLRVAEGNHQRIEGSICQSIAFCLPFDLHLACLQRDLNEVVASPNKMSEHCNLQWDSQAISVSDLCAFSLWSDPAARDIPAHVALQLSCSLD